METGAQTVFALALGQKALTGLARPRILQSIGRHSDHNKCRSTEQLRIPNSLYRGGLCVNHAEGTTTPNTILPHRDDLATLTDECDMGVITTMFACVAFVIWQDRILHVALDPSGQRLG